MTTEGEWWEKADYDSDSDGSMTAADAAAQLKVTLQSEVFAVAPSPIHPSAIPTHVLPPNTKPRPASMPMPRVQLPKKQPPRRPSKALPTPKTPTSTSTPTSKPLPILPRSNIASMTSKFEETHATQADTQIKGRYHAHSQPLVPVPAMEQEKTLDMGMQTQSIEREEDATAKATKMEITASGDDIVVLEPAVALPVAAAAVAESESPAKTDLRSHEGKNKKAMPPPIPMHHLAFMYSTTTTPLAPHTPSPNADANAGGPSDLDGSAAYEDEDDGDGGSEPGEDDEDGARAQARARARAQSINTALRDLKSRNVALQQRLADVVATTHIRQEESRNRRRTHEKQLSEMQTALTEARKPKPPALSRALMKRMKILMLVESEAIEQATQAALDDERINTLIRNNEAFAVLSVLVDRIRQLQSDVSHAVETFPPDIVVDGTSDLSEALIRVLGVADFAISMKNETSALKLRWRELRWSKKLEKDHHMSIIPVAKDGGCLFTTAWLDVVGTELLKQPHMTRQAVVDKLNGFTKNEFKAGSRSMREKMADYMRSHHTQFKTAVGESLVEAWTCATVNSTATKLRTEIMANYPGLSDEDILARLRLVPPEAFEVYLKVMCHRQVFGERSEVLALSGALGRPFHLFYMPFGWGSDIEKAIELTRVGRMPSAEQTSYGFTASVATPMARPTLNSVAPGSGPASASASQSPRGPRPPPPNMPPPRAGGERIPLPPPPKNRPRPPKPDMMDENDAYESESVPFAPTEVICAATVDPNSNAAPIRVHHQIASNHFQLLWSMRDR